MGHGGVVCEVVSPAPAPHVAPDELCQSSYVFADGQIELGGLVNTSAVPTHSPFTIGVTGGTGRYAQAHGELTVVPKSQGVNELTIDLS